MCDCASVKEILEYEGDISQICRWAQELLGYQFTIVHRSYKMMMDVDALSGRFEPLIALHCSIANILHGVDIKNRLDTYDEHALCVPAKLKLKYEKQIKNYTSGAHQVYCG